MKRIIVKLGGSTASGALMDVWIAALAGSALPVVIVPGGGAFADQVRAMQKRMNFSDRTAHAMAILAMDQFGHVILDRDDRLVPARSLEEIEQALAAGKNPVWLPSAIAIPAPDIAASWDITSDSLAAWLAGKIDADALLLIKQSVDFSEHDDIAGLAARNILDAGFSSMLPDGGPISLSPVPSMRLPPAPSSRRVFCRGPKCSLRPSRRAKQDRS